MSLPELGSVFTYLALALLPSSAVLLASDPPTVWDEASEVSCSDLPMVWDEASDGSSSDLLMVWEVGASRTVADDCVPLSRSNLPEVCHNHLLVRHLSYAGSV